MERCFDLVGLDSVRGELESSSKDCSFLLFKSVKPIKVSAALWKFTSSIAAFLAGPSGGMVGCGSVILSSSSSVPSAVKSMKIDIFRLSCESIVTDLVSGHAND